MQLLVSFLRSFSILVSVFKAICSKWVLHMFVLLSVCEVLVKMSFAAYGLVTVSRINFTLFGSLPSYEYSRVFRIKQDDLIIQGKQITGQCQIRIYLRDGNHKQLHLWRFRAILLIGHTGELTEKWNCYIHEAYITSFYMDGTKALTSFFERPWPLQNKASRNFRPLNALFFYKEHF